MAEGKLPEQETIDEIRDEARVEVLKALDDLQRYVLLDDAMGGMDAIRLGALCQQVMRKARVLGMAVNIGDEPTLRTKLAEAENAPRPGLRLRKSRALDGAVPGN